MKKYFLIFIIVTCSFPLYAWGFYAHSLINHHAVYLLPPEMIVFYKAHQKQIADHAPDPDKRRYLDKAEAPRHYIDLDFYGSYPYNELPRKWTDACKKYGAEKLASHGIVPWWIQRSFERLTTAFREKNAWKIVKLSSDIGHYLSDAHVPLHACSNYNGQLTGQQGIHAFWESRIPELMAEKNWDLLNRPAEYIYTPLSFIWRLVLESGAAADTVLRMEKILRSSFRTDQRYSVEVRKGMLTRQYSPGYCYAYHTLLDKMIERRMRASMHAIASFWFTAWVNAGQPSLSKMQSKKFNIKQQEEFDRLERSWHVKNKRGQRCD